MDRLPTFSYLAKFLTLALVLGAFSLSGCKLDSLFKVSAPELVPKLDESNTLADTAASNGLWLTSVDSAMQKAEEEKKLVMALFTGSDWCSYCVKLEKEVFETPEFEAWAGKMYVPVKLDFPKSFPLPADLTAQNKMMRSRYQEYIKGYPTVLFLDSKGEVVGKVGYARGGPTSWIARAEGQMKR